MIDVPYAGYNYYHQDGWEIHRPDGIRHYTIVFIRNPFYYVEKHGDTLSTVYVERPSFLFYRPADYQHFYRKNDPYTDDWIHFSDDSDECEILFDQLGLPFSKAVTLYDSSEPSSIMQMIAAEARKSSEHHNMIMDSLIRILLYKISDLYSKNEDNKIDFTSGAIESYRRRFNILRNRIYQGGEAARIKEVSDLASEMNMSISYFQHVYKALYGVPVTKDLIISRIEYASYLLLNQNRSIAETAAICGYDSIEHFNRQFKRLKGCSPGDYQKEKKHV
jgi:AraC family transcriptional regulator of arabinose operon